MVSRFFFAAFLFWGHVNAKVNWGPLQGATNIVIQGTSASEQILFDTLTSNNPARYISNFENGSYVSYQIFWNQVSGFVEYAFRYMPYHHNGNNVSGWERYQNAGTGFSQFYIQYALGEKDFPTLFLKWGAFDYNYNKYNKNYGNYLFRTESYPAIAYENFSGYFERNLLEVANETLFGGLISLQVFNKSLNIDLIYNRFKSPTEYLYPETHQSFSVLTRLTLNIGLGFNMGYQAYQFPRSDDYSYYFNKYVEFDGKYLFADTNTYKSQINFWEIMQTKVSEVDPYFQVTEKEINRLESELNLLRDGYQNNRVSILGPYSPSGSKLMVGLSWDLKYFLNFYEFKENDLVFFSEYILTGLKEYPLFYEKIDQRSIFSIGINLPTFNWLNELQIEIQHMDKFQYFFPYFLVPNSNLNSLDIEEIKRLETIDKIWDWSVMADKEFLFEGFFLQCKMSTDNYYQPFRYIPHKGKKVEVQNYYLGMRYQF